MSPATGGTALRTLFNATSLTWQIYADCGGVPCGDPSGGGNPPVWTLTLAPTDPQVVISTGTPGGYPSNTTLTLTATLTLPAGHWWLVFYPTMNFTSYGQYGRQPADTANGYVAQFINPGGGFGYGTVWQAWTVLGVTQTDIAFRLEGIVAPPVVAQIETWDPTKLHLLDWAATGGNVIVEPNRVVWTNEVVAPTTVTLTKWFHVEPCTWTVTTAVGGAVARRRSSWSSGRCIVHKLPPVLWIDAAYEPRPCLSGFPANFTLHLRQHRAAMRTTSGSATTFRPRRRSSARSRRPTESIPTASPVGRVGRRRPAAGRQGNIDVTVMIQPGLPPSTTIDIWDGIFDHTGELRDWVTHHLPRRAGV